MSYGYGKGQKIFLMYWVRLFQF